MQSAQPATVSPTTASMKCDLFVKVFKQELIRELHYFWDVANGRAKARDNFTKKLVSLLQKSAGSVPVVGSAVVYLATATDFAINELREKAINSVARIVDEIDLVRLGILADIVAHETLWRYEHFIVDRLSDTPAEGVIPFAKVGVARILEKVIRSNNGEGANKHVLISESLFLSGLIEGRSGSFIEGWTNHTLKLKKQKKGLFKTANAEVHAEDVYARPGFRHFYIHNGILQDDLYVREKARHHEATTVAKLKQIYHGETDSLFDFGYTKFRKSQPQEPKCGYAIMPLSIIKNRYDYKPQNKNNLSQNYLAELKQTTISRIQIDLATLKFYLEWHSQHVQSNILDFVREKFNLTGIKMVACHGDFSSLTLARKNLSHMDLSGSVFSGDLTETQFNHSYLIGARFINVISAVRCQFYQAYAPMLYATGVNFAETDFSQANLSYAILDETDMTSCKTYGTQWSNSQLRGIKSELSLQQEHKAYAEATQKELQQQKDAIKQLNEEMDEQYTSLRKLQIEYQETLADQVDPSQNETTQKKIQDLIQREEVHTAFEIYCKNEMLYLHKALAKAVHPDEIDKLQAYITVTTASLENHYREQQMHIDSELSLVSENLKNQNQRFSDFQDRFTKALQENQTILNKKFNFLKISINQVQQVLTARLEKIEDRVENLEDWMEEAKSAFKQLKTNQKSNHLLQEKIANLELDLQKLTNQNLKHEELCDQIALLQARVNQSTHSNTTNQLETQLHNRQRDFQKLLSDSLFHTIQGNLANLQNELLETKDSDKNIKAQQMLENLLLHFTSQVRAIQESAKYLLKPNLVVKADHVVINKKIAESAFEKIYSGTWQNQSIIIKTTQEAFSEQDTSRILREINILSRLNHPNIIRFHGAYLEDSRPFLIMEKTGQGSLHQYLENKILSQSQQEQIILDIVRGLKYLHSQGILHRQLQSKNILLTEEGRAKLTGFGLAKTNLASLASANISLSSQADQLRWCAPEFINDPHGYRRQADIYSLGLLIWGVFTGKEPFAGCSEKEILKRLKEGKNEVIPLTIPAQYRDLIAKCWKQDPLERPTLKFIIEKISKLDEPTPSERPMLAQVKLKNETEVKSNNLSLQVTETTRSRTNTGNFFLTGKNGVPQDKVLALQCFLKSAEEKHVRAMINAAQMLEYGDGVGKDLKEALRWYEEAAKLGDQEALKKVEHVKRKLSQVAPASYF